MNDVLDQNLQEVVASVAQYRADACVNHAVKVPLQPGDTKTDNANLITQIWRFDGTLVFVSSVVPDAHRMHTGCRQVRRNGAPTR